MPCEAVLDGDLVLQTPSHQPDDTQVLSWILSDTLQCRLDLFVRPPSVLGARTVVTISLPIIDTPRSPFDSLIEPRNSVGSLEF